MRFAECLFLLLLGVLLFCCKPAFSQTVCQIDANGNLVCTGTVADQELMSASEGDTLSDGSVVTSVGEWTTVTTVASPQRSIVTKRKFRPVRRIVGAAARAPFRIGRAMAQGVRRGVARRSARRAERNQSRANRAAAKFNAVRSRR